MYIIQFLRVDTYYNTVVMSAVDSKDNTPLCPRAIDVKLAIIPRPAHEVTDALVVGDVIVARGDGHRYRYTGLRNKTACSVHNVT